MQGERLIQNGILEWLAWNNIFAFPVKSVGTYDVKEGKFRRPSKYYKRGTADILGIYKGKFLAIEVKSEKGRPSIHQKIFLEQVNKEGGLGFIARSIDDVERELKK